MGLLRRPLPEGVVALPPPEWFKSGIYLGMAVGDGAGQWFRDGMPQRRDDWHLDAILGGQRSVNGVDLTEATAIMIGGPGAGKTAGWQAGVILQWGRRGPMVVISTKPDQARWTGPFRERVGNVYVLDWRGQQAASLSYQRVKWNPLDGCEDAGVARRRVKGMMETALLGGAAGDPFWEKNAVAIVAAYAHSAELKGAGVEQVLDWLDKDELKEPARVIKAHGSRARMGARLATFDGKAEETREGVLHMARLVFEACEDPAVLDGCTPDMLDAFDIDQFLDSSDTLYILDKGGETTISEQAPLTVALVNAIIQRAEAKADATTAGTGRLAGRLERPLLVVIDEVANISPLPNLEHVLSEGRSRGIAVVVAAQAWGQLTKRWGAEGASAIWDTCAYRLVGAGLQDQGDGFLTNVSKTLGEAERWRKSVGAQSGGGGNNRSSKSESHTLMETPRYKMSGLATLPEGKAILMGREGARPVQLPMLPSLLKALERAEEVAAREANPLKGLPDTAYGPDYQPDTWGWPPYHPPWWKRLLRSVTTREGTP
ncbi:MAG: type IV secretory system conjugative DNA transfer family protein [Candidatus Dormibacteria bacterium]